MTDTSDGETKQRQFANLRIVSPNESAQRVANSSEFMNLCYNITQGMNISVCVEEFKSRVNNDQFKKYMAIPRNSIIEPNISESNISLLFKYKKHSHPLKIKINNELVNAISENYKKSVFLTEQTKAKNSSIDNENPISDTSQSQAMSMEQKIDKLIQQVDNLTKLLAEEQQKNKKLTEKLLKYESDYHIANKATKRKKKIVNTSVNKKQFVNMSEDTCADVFSIDESMDSSEDEIQTHLPHTHNESDNVNELITTNTIPTNAPRGQATQQHSVSTKRNSPGTKPPTKREKNIPPIVVFDDDQKRMSERITNRKICTNTEYHFVRVNKSKYRIQVNTLEQYDAMLELLNEFGIKYHTYTPIERKPIHVLLKRIPICYNEEDILHFLKEDHGVIPIRLTKFTTKRMIDSGVESSIWHASFDPKTDKKRIFGIKHIGNVYGILIEQLKNKSITQCRRCWRYEHTESNCSYDVRCPNCLATHELGKCILDTNAAIKPACVNCNNDSHAANSRECPVYQRILNRKNSPGNKQPKKVNSMPNTTNANPHTSKGVSFAHAVRGGRQQNENTYSNTNIEMLNILKHLATQQMQMNELIMKIAPQLVSNNKR